MSDFVQCNIVEILSVLSESDTTFMRFLLWLINLAVCQTVNRKIHHLRKIILAHHSPIFIRIKMNYSSLGKSGMSNSST